MILYVAHAVTGPDELPGFRCGDAVGFPHQLYTFQETGIDNVFVGVSFRPKSCMLSS